MDIFMCTTPYIWLLLCYFLFSPSPGPSSLTSILMPLWNKLKGTAVFTRNWRKICVRSLALMLCVSSPTGMKKDCLTFVVSFNNFYCCNTNFKVNIPMHTTYRSSSQHGQCPQAKIYLHLFRPQI